MRRWYHPNPGPNGEPVAPGQYGGTRLDTLTDDPSTPLVEASQTDTVPQVIEPSIYAKLAPGPVFGRYVKFPHPVLCGPNGPITHLPDHMHEGLIEVPSVLTYIFSFDGHTTEEYPQVGGHREKPQVIGTATNFVTGQQFGVLGAYDGHKANVGRVVVDATWHHWFNINMTPYIDGTTPGHATYDPTLIPKWEEIKAYLRNVAAWLSPPSMQTCVRNGGWVFALGYADIAITIRGLDRIDNHLGYYWQVGTFAKDALGRLASQCQTVVWLVDVFDLVQRSEFFPDPYEDEPSPWDRPGTPPFIDVDDLSSIVLGGAIHALATEIGLGDMDRAQELLENEDAVTRIVRRGAKEAFEVLANAYQESCAWFGENDYDKS